MTLLTDGNKAFFRKVHLFQVCTNLPYGQPSVALSRTRIEIQAIRLQRDARSMLEGCVTESLL